MISDLVQRHKASITRAIRNQVESRRIERVLGVGLREYQRKRHRRRKKGKGKKARLVCVMHFFRLDHQVLSRTSPVMCQKTSASIGILAIPLLGRWS